MAPLGFPRGALRGHGSPLRNVTCRGGRLDLNLCPMKFGRFIRSKVPGCLRQRLWIVHVLLLVGPATAASEAGTRTRDFDLLSKSIRRVDAAMSESVHAARAYEQAKALHRESPGRPELAWAFARACFDRCEALASKPVRISVAQEGVEACRQALRVFPAEAGCHYYLGLNLGILAQCQPLRALGRVREMEKAWQASRLLDDGFDHAGADRSLGMLYAECPPPPLGVGSRSKARNHLARAVELAPGYPENRLQWIEFLVRDGDTDAARREFAALKSLLPTARDSFQGEHWTGSWSAWNARIASLETRLLVGNKQANPGK